LAFRIYNHFFNLMKKSEKSKFNHKLLRDLLYKELPIRH